MKQIYLKTTKIPSFRKPSAINNELGKKIKKWENHYEKKCDSIEKSIFFACKLKKVACPPRNEVPEVLNIELNLKRMTKYVKIWNKQKYFVRNF